MEKTTGIRKALDDVLALYSLARQDSFGGNEVAELLRRGLPDEVRSVLSVGLPDAEFEYIVKGSAGHGQWNRCPWVAVFDTQVTISPQSGYYPVYLFCEDMSGVYLSLNQGVSDVREQYKSKRKDALTARAADFRARLGDAAKGFSELQIDLKASSTQSYSADYEAGNIVAKYYTADNLPAENDLRGDLFQLLALYEELRRSAEYGLTRGVEPEELENNFIEDYAAFSYHRRVERNPKLVKAVKKARGFTCEACGIRFSKTYPGVDKNKYIEAHHLVPIADLKGLKLCRDPKKDFIVLCANCHRMIHRFRSPGDLDAFRKQIDLTSLRRIGDR